MRWRLEEIEREGRERKEGKDRLRKDKNRGEMMGQGRRGVNRRKGK